MANKMSFSQKMDETKTAASQLTCWCVLIALHQNFGVGAERLNRMTDKLYELQEASISTMMSQGTRAADKQREGWLQGKAALAFQLPLLRAPRGRTEQQLRMAADDAASIAWQLYAAACIKVLGYGQERMERLRQASRENCRQYLTWAADDPDWAMENVKRCAENALKEELRIVDDDPEGWNKLKEELRTTQNLAARVMMSSSLAKPGAHPAEDEQGAIFARCMAETMAAGGKGGRL